MNCTHAAVPIELHNAASAAFINAVLHTSTLDAALIPKPCMQRKDCQNRKGPYLARSSLRTKRGVVEFSLIEVPLFAPTLLEVDIVKGSVD